MRQRINWANLREHAWYEGVIALILSPVAFPISIWYFNSVLRARPDFSVTGWAFVAQLIQAGLAVLFAFAAGMALDIMQVRIATGAPTHKTWYLSLNFWAPIVCWVMTSVITYDYYSDHTWVWSPTTATHLAYPTATTVAALYFAFSRNWSERAIKPFQEKIAAYELQIKEWQIQLNDRLQQEAERWKTQLEELIVQVGGLTADVEDARMRARAYAEENGELRTKLSQAQAERSDIAAQPFQYLTAREAIEAQLSREPEMTNDELAEALRIKPDQMATFRSQCAQVRAQTKRQGSLNGHKELV